MRTVRCASLGLIGLVGSLTVASSSRAQDLPPPPPPLPSDTPSTQPAEPPAAPPPVAAPAPAAPAAAEAAPTEPPAAGSQLSADAGAAAAGTQGEWDAEAEYGPDGASADDTSGEAEAGADGMSESERRRRSLQIQNSLGASTGLLRLREAGSGAAGTFRVSLVTGYFSTSEFLCQTNTDCPRADGRAMKTDSASRVSEHLALSLTPWSFLEAFVGIHTTATYNNQNVPELLQVLGDANFGVKAFTPQKDDSLLSYGADLDIWLLNGTGDVGLDFGATSFGITGVATADFTSRIDPADRVPLRLHANLGYFVNNAGELVEDTEKDRNTRITRVERFGLDIDRVDSVRIGLGAEYVHEVVRPFAEWTWEIPSNRQGYKCFPDVAFPKDGCLRDDGDFGAHPSRLTLGARLYPWFDGFNLLGALDIGTGATNRFIEEVAPEPPWQLYFGVGIAADTAASTADEISSEPTILESPTRTISGVVVNAETKAPIPDAQIRYKGLELTGMLSGTNGTFQSVDLAPGTYTLAVHAEGFHDGECLVEITEGAPVPGAASAPAAAPGGTEAASPELGPDGMPVNAAEPQYGPDGMPITQASPDAAQYGPDGQPLSEPSAGADPNADMVFPVECQLQALPPLGTFEGVLRDAETGAPVPLGSVVITDKLGRQLTLEASSSGEFRFTNVPPGMVRLSVSKPGYLPSVAEIEIKAFETVDARIRLNPRPAEPQVTVKGTAVVTAKPILFQDGSAELLPESIAVVQEVAQVLQESPDLKLVEVQGYMDNEGDKDVNLRLSQERAEAVRRSLVDLGVDAARLSSAGYGQDKPLTTNATPAGRAKNRRIEFLVKEKN